MQLELVMQSVLEGSILESQGLSLGIVVKVHMFWEFQRGCYRKARIDPSLAMIDPWRNILLNFFFLHWFKFFVVSAPKDQSFMIKILILCPRIVDFSKAIYSFQSYIVSIEVSFTIWVYNSSECSSSDWFLIQVD